MEEKNEKDNTFGWGDFFANLTDEDIERYKKAEEQSKYTIKNFIDDLTCESDRNE